MRTVTSKDGTTIAFDQVGKGPALIFVDGALQYRAFDQGMAPLADLLSPHFTVFRYDRRGRGDSTDWRPGAVQPYALAREIEDVEAIIAEAGGSAYVYGISSGAALAMEMAVTLGDKIEKLVMYEAPYNDDPAAREAWRTYRKQLNELLAEDRKGEALGLFMMLVGAHADQVEALHQHPMWGMWEAVAQTLAYDAAALGEEAAVPKERASQVTSPTLIMDGSASFPFMHVTATALAQAIPHAQHRTLEGQPHEVEASALAPVLTEFFNS
jgi:pimeloyl-ACP methyl ester carboxylesterase